MLTIPGWELTPATPDLLSLWLLASWCTESCNAPKKLGLWLNDGQRACTRSSSASWLSMTLAVTVNSMSFNENDSHGPDIPTPDREDQMNTPQSIWSVVFDQKSCREFKSLPMCTIWYQSENHSVTLNNKITAILSYCRWCFVQYKQTVVGATNTIGVLNVIHCYQQCFCFQNSIKCFLDTLIQEIFF